MTPRALSHLAAAQTRVLVLAPAFPPTIGGIELLAYRLCSHAKQLRPEVITPWVVGAPAFDACQTFSIRRTHAWLPRGVPGRLTASLCLRFLAAARAKQSHVTLCTHIGAGLPALAAKRLFGLPYTVYCHGTELHPPTLRRERINRAILHGAALVVANSRYTQGVLERCYQVPPARISIVPPAVDTCEFHPGVSRGNVRERFGLEDARVVLTVGRFNDVDRHKGQDRVIQVLPEVLRHVPETRYLLVGRGLDKKKLRQAAHQAGVLDQVIFAGAVSQEELPEFYAACDVYVMPTRHLRLADATVFEGFGTVFAEAGAAGRAVIGGSTGGVQDAVLDGETGLLIDPENDQELADAMVQLLSDQSLAAELGEAGRERAVREFSCEAVVAQFESAVLRALAPPSAAGHFLNSRT
jgi:phosphatidylinositol alpha-1,6-mannosyltransferase